MVDVVRRRGRLTGRQRGERRGPLGQAAQRYAAMGWPVCAGAHLRNGGPDSGSACSCDRVGCPAPGGHPLSPAWQMLASTDPEVVGGRWESRPDANVILVTGRVFDVLDVPARAGAAALAAMARSGVTVGPVATTGDRMLFFVATRGNPDDEDEWWSCHLDCEPESVTEEGSVRWHCRDSYVPAPPSRTGPGLTSRWVREPDGRPLPDAVRLLEFLADACEEAVAQ